jgi:hypothetical protein
VKDHGRIDWDEWSKTPLRSKALADDDPRRAPEASVRAQSIYRKYNFSPLSRLSALDERRKAVKVRHVLEDVAPIQWMDLKSFGPAWLT